MVATIGAIAASGAMLILLVEDNSVTQTVIEEFLRGDGHRVDVVGDGQAAVDALLAVRYDLVLMDMHMPVMDGHAATHLIRAIGTDSADVPIVALTGGDNESGIQACLAAGMNDVVPKPVDWEVLRAVIGRLVPSPVARD